MSRALEAAGIPSVAIFVGAFEHLAGRLRLSRVLVTPHLMGRTVGPVGDHARQRPVVEAALALLTGVDGPETLRRF